MRGDRWRLRRPVRRDLWLVGAWIVLLLAGYGAGRAFAGAHLGWDVGLSTDMPSIRGTPLTGVMKGASDVGSPVVIDAVFIVAAAVLVWRRRLRALTYLVLSAAGTVLLAQTLKAWVQRPRPTAVSHVVQAAGWSWPSGHASSAVAIYGALAALAFVLVRRRPWRTLLVAGAVALILLIGFSRVYLGVHYATDVLGGWVLGTAWLVAVAWRVGDPFPLRPGPTRPARRGRRAGSRAGARVPPVPRERGAR